MAEENRLSPEITDDTQVHVPGELPEEFVKGILSLRFHPFFVTEHYYFYYDDASIIRDENSWFRCEKSTGKKVRLPDEVNEALNAEPPEGDCLLCFDCRCKICGDVIFYDYKNSLYCLDLNVSPEEIMPEELYGWSSAEQDFDFTPNFLATFYRNDQRNEDGGGIRIHDLRDEAELNIDAWKPIDEDAIKEGEALGLFFDEELADLRFNEIGDIAFLDEKLYFEVHNYDTDNHALACCDPDARELNFLEFMQDCPIIKKGEFLYSILGFNRSVIITNLQNNSQQELISVGRIDGIRYKFSDQYLVCWSWKTDPEDDEEDTNSNFTAIELATGKVKKIPLFISRYDCINRFFVAGTFLYCLKDDTGYKVDLSESFPQPQEFGM